MNPIAETPAMYIRYKTIMHRREVSIAISRARIEYLLSPRSSRRSKVGTELTFSKAIMEIRVKFQFLTSKPKRGKQTLTKQQKKNLETKNVILYQYI